MEYRGYREYKRYERYREYRVRVRVTRDGRIGRKMVTAS